MFEQGKPVKMTSVAFISFDEIAVCISSILNTLSVLIFAVQMFRGGCEFAGCKFAVKKSRFSRGLIFAVYLGLFNAK